MSLFFLVFLCLYMYACVYIYTQKNCIIYISTMCSSYSMHGYDGAGIDTCLTIRHCAFLPRFIRLWICDEETLQLTSCGLHVVPGPGGAQAKDRSPFFLFTVLVMSPLTHARSSLTPVGHSSLQSLLPTAPLYRKKEGTGSRPTWYRDLSDTWYPYVMLSSQWYIEHAGLSRYWGLFFAYFSVPAAYLTTAVCRTREKPRILKLDRLKTAPSLDTCRVRVFGGWGSASHSVDVSRRCLATG